MSFSKAKIQRFNELGSEAPPPGAYDPKFDSKIKGLVLEKTERFPDNKSVCSTSADSHASGSSKAASSTSAQKFRNPQPPQRKHVIVKPQSLLFSKRGNSKSPNVRSKEQKAQYDVTNELSDLKVECANKSKTIEEYEEQMQNMMSELQDLRQLVNEQKQKDAEVEEQHRKDIEAMAKLQQQVLDSREEKYRAEVELLRSQLMELSVVKEKELFEQHNAVSEWKNKAMNLESELSKINEEIEKLQESEAVFKEKLDKISKEKNDIENLIALQDEMKIELKDLKLEEVKEEQRKLCQRLNEVQAKLNSEKKRDDEITYLEGKIISNLENLLKYHLEVKLKYIVLCSEQQIAVNDFEQQIINLEETYAKELEGITNEHLQEKEDLMQQLQLMRTAVEEQVIEIQSVRSSLEEFKKKREDMQNLLELMQTSCTVEKAELEGEILKLNEKLIKVEKESQEIIKNTELKHSEEKAKLMDELLKLKKNNENLEKMYIAREEELTEVKKSMSKKIEEVKKHADKMIENAEAVTRETLIACRNESEEKVKRIIAETDSKVHVMVQEAKNTVNEEMQSTADRYAACLERVEAERATLDEKLTQRDTEITWLSAALEELKTTAETQESFSQSLQAELDRVETELAERKEELRTLKDQIRLESAEMVARRRRFEVVMAENQASVNALMQRLAQSDAEVERLQRELKSGELCINEHRDLLSAMRNSSKLVNDQMYSLMDQLDSKRGLIDQLEINNLADIESIRVLFDAKIDNLKQITAKEITQLNEECDKKTELNTKLKQQLDNMSEKLKDAQDILLKLEEKNDEYSIEIAQLEMAKEKLEQLLKERDQVIDKNEAVFKAQSTKYEDTIHEANRQIIALTEHIDNIKESKILKQKEDIELKETLEQEIKAKLKLEEQVKSLSEACERFQKEYQEISEKYSEILGHHNTKQRVKHISQLKEKIYAQQVEILRLKQELESKTKILDHLSKGNEKRLHNKGKENVQSNAVPKNNQNAPRSTSKKPVTGLQPSTPLTKNMSSTVVSSSSPHTPLRHRNE